MAEKVKTIDVDGEPIDFPVTMTDAQIVEAIKKIRAEKQATGGIHLPPMQPEPVKKPTTIFQATTPRVMGETEAPSIKTMGKLGLDILSMPGRAIAAGAGKLAEKAAGYKPGEGVPYAESMAKTKGEGMISDIARSPATIPSMMVPAPISIAGKVLPTAIRAGIAGLEQGLVSSGIRQGERALQGEKVSVPEMLTETGVSTGFGLVGGGIAGKASQMLKKEGAQTINAILRPGHMGADEGFVIENVFKKYPVGEGKKIMVAGNDVPAMENNVDKIMNHFDAQRDKIIQKSKAHPIVMKEKGTVRPSVKIDWPEVQVNLDNATTAIYKKFENPQEHIVDKKLINKYIDEVVDQVREATGGSGNLTLENAMKFKSDLGKKGAWVSTPSGKMGDPDADAKEKVYNAFFKEVKDAVNNTIDNANLNHLDGIKDIRALNKLYEEVIPISQVIKRRLAISETNIPKFFTLKDLFMGAMGAGYGLIPAVKSGLSPAQAALLGTGIVITSAASRTGYGGIAKRAAGQIISPETRAGRVLGAFPAAGIRGAVGEQYPYSKKKKKEQMPIGGVTP